MAKRPARRAKAGRRQPRAKATKGTKSTKAKRVARARKGKRPAPKARRKKQSMAAAADGAAAAAVECLDQEVATALVFSCIAVGEVAPSTTLGTLFPSDIQRRGFCGCVFQKAREAGLSLGPSDVPCSAGTSVREVIDRISC